MSEATPTKNQESTTDTCKKQCGGCSQLPLYISIVALLLAVYAAAGVSKAPDTTAFQGLESKVEGLSQQLDSLGKNVADNRSNLMQTKLKRALDNLVEAGDLATEETKARVTEIKTMLQNLTHFDTPTEDAAATTQTDTAITHETTDSTPTADLSAPAEAPTASTPEASSSEQSSDTSAPSATESATTTNGEPTNNSTPAPTTEQPSTANDSVSPIAPQAL